MKEVVDLNFISYLFIRCVRVLCVCVCVCVCTWAGESEDGEKRNINPIRVGIIC